MNLGFASSEFVFLLPLVAALYYLMPARIRQYYLLVINSLFLLSFGYLAILVILYETAVAYLVSRVYKKCQTEKAKKRTIALGIVFLLGALVFFKFGGFAFESIIAPIGLSFYTLQAISYVVDIKREEIQPERNIAKLYTFLSFFPTVTSGPIYRYQDFSKSQQRILRAPKPKYNRIIGGIIFLLYGYFLKLMISARVGMIADKVFGDYKEVEYGALLIVAVIAYSLQIYTDFAGYSAIVIGIAQMLGYTIPENFTMPYLSTSLREFWGRWHRSFSSWLRDYVYIPLGGNRKGKLRKYANTLITFLVSGLWHGTGVNFLLWGGGHGLLRIFEDMVSKTREKEHAVVASIKRIIVFIMVSLLWIFFRTKGTDAFNYIYQMCAGLSQGIPATQLMDLGLTIVDWVALGVSVFIMFVFDEIQYRKDKRIDKIILARGAVLRCAIVIIMTLVILIFGVYGPQHDASYFIYRDF